MVRPIDGLDLEIPERVHFKACSARADGKTTFAVVDGRDPRSRPAGGTIAVLGDTDVTALDGHARSAATGSARSASSSSSPSICS